MHGFMRISLGLALLSAVTTAAPAPQRVVPRAALGDAGSVAPRQAANDTAQLPSDTQIRNAVMGWAKDTGKVTQFVNTATSFTGDEYTRQAQIALNAELDELNHKKILDAGLSNDPNVQAANDVLENQGTFQNVVDVLQNMVNNGPDTAQADVDAINNNRCVNVLPNIDAYFAAAGMPEVTAVRPTGCLEIEGGAPTGALPPPVAQDPGNSSSVTDAPAETSSSSADADATSTSDAAASETTSSESDAEAASASITSEEEAASATSSAAASATDDMDD